MAFSCHAVETLPACADSSAQNVPPASRPEPQSDWQALNDKVMQLYREGKYAEAAEWARKALELAENSYGSEHPRVAVSLNNLAGISEAQGKLDEAAILYQRALSMREKYLGPDDPSVANSLNNLAALYHTQGKLSAAEPLLRRALAIREKVFGPEHPDVANSANNLASLLLDRGRHADAELLLRRAVKIRQNVFGPEDPILAGYLNNLAGVYDAQGKYADAESLYVQALAIREKALGPEHPAVAATLSDFGVLYERQGKFAQAEPLYLRALAIREKVLGPEHHEVALVQNNLCALYHSLGRWADAESRCQLALQKWTNSLGPDHPSVADALNNLALVYDQQGRFSKVEPLYRRALGIREKALGPGHPAVANSLNNLALLYEEQGKYAEAEPLLRRALEIREKTLGPNHSDVATSLNNLASLYDRQNKPSEAEALYLRALHIAESVQGPEHPDVATALNNLAQLFNVQKRYSEAEPLFRRALSIREKVQGPEHPDVALALNNLAGIFRAQEKYEQAEPLYLRSLDICEKAFGPDHPLTGNSLLNVAGFYFLLGQVEKAESAFARSLHNLARQFDEHFTYMSEKERLGFLSKVANSFPLYFSFCLAFRDSNPALVGKMYDVVLWQKGFVTTSVSALRARIAASGDRASLELLEQLTAGKTRLARLMTALPVDRVSWRKEIELLEQANNELEQQLVRRSAALAAEKMLRQVTWRNVAKSLKRGEAAVEVIRFQLHDGKHWTGKKCYVALLLTSESSEAPTLIQLGDASDFEDAPLLQYRQYVGLKSVSASIGIAPQTGKAPPRSGFYSVFWKPIENAFHNASRIYLSPDGVLNQISLGILTDGAGRLLLDKYDLRILTSTRDLLRQKQAAANRTAVLLGNPNFSAGETAVSNESGRTRAMLGDELVPLPATQAELLAVSRLLTAKRWRVKVHSRAEASEAVVKQVRSPRLLHIATHGFFQPDQPRPRPSSESEQPFNALDPMLRSGLFFAGADRTLLGGEPLAEQEDGILTAYEAAGLDLQGTELVVLSACETGLGQSVAGEGVFGLRRSFQIAGAGAVLMSMWAVPDRETQELMSLFYAYWLSGKEKSRALRDAQLEIRARVRARYGSDLPVYWGAFVLVGP